VLIGLYTRLCHAFLDFNETGGPIAMKVILLFVWWYASVGDCGMGAASIFERRGAKALSGEH